MLTINYNTGAGNDTAVTLQDAMRTADEGASYTQCNIDIEDEDGNIVAQRQWCGCTTDIELCDNPIDFGDFGFYGDWIVF